jgi:hypothetical protein
MRWEPDRGPDGPGGGRAARLEAGPSDRGLHRLVRARGLASIVFADLVASGGLPQQGLVVPEVRQAAFIGVGPVERWPSA